MDGAAKARQALTDPRFVESYNRSEHDRILSEADAEAGERLAQAELHLQVAEAQLTQATMPRVKRDEQSLARQDLEVALKGANTPAEFMERIKMLAAGNDSIAGLAADGRYLDLLMLRYGKSIDRGHAEAIKTMAREAAIAGARQSGDASRELAAQTLDALRANLSKALVGAYGVRRHTTQRRDSRR
jgi:hypothetical protein